MRTPSKYLPHYGAKQQRKDEKRAAMSDRISWLKGLQATLDEREDIELVQGIIDVLAKKWK